MQAQRHVAVIDIGKTTAKVALVDLDRLAEIDLRRQPNAVLPGPPYPHYDIEGLWRFILDGLQELNAAHRIDAVTVTTHGASAALLGADGVLAAPVLDYEYEGPDTLAAAYDAVRPAFSDTGSPRLPIGLNLGAQLYWQFRTFPDVRARTRRVVTYPQYWAGRLCGTYVNEATSLGCHTDLWDPHAKRFSKLVETEGWSALMAPVANATDLLGTILGDVAAATGMPPDIPVYCGIHDSNASLYAHLISRQSPFSVVSTGTWVISMAIGGRAVALDPARDTLINVNAFGDAVPSARFMGGREFERLTAGRERGYKPGDVHGAIEKNVMLLPSVEPHSGPFQGRQQDWTVEEQNLSAGERLVAISFYLALMTATGLEMIGALGPVLVEGPFAENEIYLDMLAAATGRPVAAIAGTGTSIGAALLTQDSPVKADSGSASRPADKPSWNTYARRWQALAGRDRF